MDDMETVENPGTLEEQMETAGIQRPKRKLTDKQKEATTLNLAKGRAIRDEKLRVQKEEKQLKLDENTTKIEALVAKKAQKIATKQAKKEDQLKKLLGDIDSDDDNDRIDVEERIFKKPKKKTIIYREESDSEEEVIVRKKRPAVALPPSSPTPASVPVPKRVPAIMFY